MIVPENRIRFRVSNTTYLVFRPDGLIVLLNFIYNKGILEADEKVVLAVVGARITNESSKKQK